MPIDLIDKPRNQTSRATALDYSLKGGLEGKFFRPLGAKAEIVEVHDAINDGRDPVFKVTLHYHNTKTGYYDSIPGQLVGVHTLTTAYVEATSDEIDIVKRGSSHLPLLNRR